MQSRPHDTAGAIAFVPHGRCTDSIWNIKLALLVGDRMSGESLLEMFSVLS